MPAAVCQAPVAGAIFSRDLSHFRDRAGFRPLPRPSDFFFAGPKKKITKKKWPPRTRQSGDRRDLRDFRTRHSMARSENGGRPARRPTGPDSVLAAHWSDVSRDDRRRPIEIFTGREGG